MFASTDVNDMIKAGKDRFSNDLIKGVAQQGFRTMDFGGCR